MLEKYRYSESEQKTLLGSLVIVVDTREKVNAHILDYFDKHNIAYVKKALPFGDYSVMIPQNDDLSIPRDLHFHEDIIIERKNSAEELSGNFSQSRARFEEEFASTKAMKKYLLIENCSYADIVNGNYDTQYNSKSYQGSLHSFNHKYNLETVFMPDNKYSPIFIYNTLLYYIRDLTK